MADEKYDQDFFIALALKGKDAWNAWRRNPANKDVYVTFAGIDFSERQRDEIDFSGFEFGDDADFSGCNWLGVEWAEIQEDPKAFAPGRACFIGTAFGKWVRFTGAAFGDFAVFVGADFGEMASFDGAAFGYGSSFNGAAFGRWTSFGSAVFDGKANFDRATFGDWAIFFGAGFGIGASFTGSAFGRYVSFDGAAFGPVASFDGTRFKGHIEFTGKSSEGWSRSLGLNAEETNEKVKESGFALKKRHEDSWKRWGSGPDRFLTISFERARFDGEAIFSGRTFERAADFTTARFYYPPDFDAAINVARIDFTGAYIGFGRPLRFHWTSETTVVVRLRALRKIAEDTKNHDLERDLYVEERKAERGVYLRQRWDELKKAPWIERPLIAWRLMAHLFWILVMLIYWALANYGRSFLLPAAWLGLSVPFFHWRYAAILAPLMPQAGTLDAAKYARAEWMVALGNAVPFVGPVTVDAEIKKFLFCPGFGKCLPLPPDDFQAQVVGQNLVSIILVFFIGLALRNYFRIK